MFSTIFTNKKNEICLSGYTFRHALMSHADILDMSYNPKDMSYNPKFTTSV